jgi:hypothetical protein
VFLIFGSLTITSFFDKDFKAMFISASGVVLPFGGVNMSSVIGSMFSGASGAQYQSWTVFYSE